MLLAQLIFGNFSDQEGKGLNIPIEYRPLCPLRTHPASATADPPPPAPQAFLERYKLYEERSMQRQNYEMEENGRTEPGMTFGAWVQMDDAGKPDSKEPLGPTSMAFFSDIGRMTYEVLPKNVKERGIRW